MLGGVTDKVNADVVGAGLCETLTSGGLPQRGASQSQGTLAVGGTGRPAVQPGTLQQ